MGSPLAFEYRRKELQSLGFPYSDQDVTNSFISIITPTNNTANTNTNNHISTRSSSTSTSNFSTTSSSIMSSSIPTTTSPTSSSSSISSISCFQGVLVEYLLEGEIVVILGDTLYVHGAILPSNMGWLPPTGKIYIYTYT